MDFAYASLAHIRILLIPVNPISPQAFERWSTQLQEFNEIRLSDIPADNRDERARFMPNPLASGSLLLTFTKHPPSSSHSSFDLFRPSDFPLGVVGVSSCSHSDSLSSIYSNFNAALSELNPAQSPFPLARNCFVFEEGDGNTNLNVGNHLQGLFVIPSMMGNKRIYLGTLLAELCSSILGEFAMIIRALESPIGSQALGAGLFGRSPNTRSPRVSYDAGEPERPFSLAGLPSLQTRDPDPRANMRRASTMGPGVTPSNSLSSQLGPAKKKVSNVNGGGTMHARLYKVLGDFFLLSGRTMDATIWYNEAIHGLRQPQDIVWIASAHEGLAISGIIEQWAISHGSTSDMASEAWRDFAEKLSKAIQYYSAAADEPEAEGSMHEVTYLYVTACLRQASLMHFVWLGDGLGALAFEGLIHGRLEAFVEKSAQKVLDHGPVDDATVGPVLGVSRSDVAICLSQAHGPWLLHLGARERIAFLKCLAAMYSSLGFRRKEVYVLRELLACLLDLLIQGREEARSLSETIIGASGRLNPAISKEDIGMRGKDDTSGNSSILRLQQYICEIHGLDLVSVDFEPEPPTENTVAEGSADELATRSMVKYMWPELQIGLLRETLEIAEALPDYAAIVRFSLSALRNAHHLLDSEEQFRFHTSAARSMATIKRRGDSRRLQFWPEQIVSGIHFVPLPYAKLPIERRWSELEAKTARKELKGLKTDPFLFNPHRVTINKRNAYAVCNESLEFVVTFDNPYAITLDITAVSLCTSGVAFTGTTSSLVIQGNSSASVTLSGRTTEAGLLIVRGCSVELPGLIRHEILLPVLTEEEQHAQHFEALARINAEEKRKCTSIADRLRKDRDQKRLTMQLSSKTGPPKYLEVQIVPEQPTLRIRRTSLTNGAVMLYDGETSTIRLTVENISSLPVDFLELTFEDSTKLYYEQLLNAEEPSVFDTYEAEHTVVNRPVLSWDQDNSRKCIAAGQENTLSVKCYGKSSCTDGTIFIAYSCTHKPQESLAAPPSVFYTRQIILPLLITVYQMLKCSAMNILPMSAMDRGGVRRKEWDGLLGDTDVDDWCIFAVDVLNTYGLPFEVTLTFDSMTSASRVVPPGSTYKILLPIKRFFVPVSKASSSIPTLTGRQFIVSKMDDAHEKATRELFWYREELLERLKATWKEASGSRHGELSLRRQRFTQPMMYALRRDEIRVKLGFSPNVEDRNEDECARARDKLQRIVQPNDFVSIIANVQNLTDGPLIMSLTLTADPADYFVCHGTLSDIPLGRLNTQETKVYTIQASFVAAGQFQLSAEVFGFSDVTKDVLPCGRGTMTVLSRGV